MLEAVGRVGAAVLVDQSAAYDLLDHQVLLSKLKMYGLTVCALGLIKSYLVDRNQRVVLQSKGSELATLEPYGVPQGSVLGGLFYVLHTISCWAAGVAQMTALSTWMTMQTAWLRHN